MMLRKCFALGVALVLLATQLWAIVPPGRASWKSYYWPFMDYPMYSGAHRRGEVFVQHRLTGTPCGAEAGETEPIQYWHIRLQRFNFYKAVARIAGPWSADPRLVRRYPEEGVPRATEFVGRLIHSQRSGRYCRVQVWEQAFVLGEPVPVDWQEAGWRMLYEWEIAGGDGTVPDTAPAGSRP